MRKEEFIPSAEVVLKGGARGAVSYVIDDGARRTATIIKELESKYKSLKVTHAIPTKAFATLIEKTLPDGTIEYAKDENGKYLYTKNEETIEFWKNIMNGSPSEIVSHTHTHEFWGYHDLGGEQIYYDLYEKAPKVSTLPVGSVTKELYASKQILKDNFSEFERYKFTAIVRPGIGANTVEMTLDDGTVIPTFRTLYNKLVAEAIASGEYIGNRSNFGSRDFRELATASDFYKYVGTRERFADMSYRANIDAFLITSANVGGAGAENAKRYIDAALDLGGLACFCIHNIENDWLLITREEANAIFSYTDTLGKDVWVACFTEAIEYFSEWATSTLEVTSDEAGIAIALDTKEDKSLFTTPLTVKLSVPPDWTKVDFLGGTYDTVSENSGKFVYIDILPNGEKHIVRKA